MTKQMQEWSGDFGKEYTNRNAFSPQELDLLYQEYYGITRMEMDCDFIGDFDRGMKILEVGSSIGNQLLLLQKMGFKNLYGIELQSYAVELSKSKTKGINIIQGSALDIPFKDYFFDLVFTSGLLIHIAPKGITKVLDEIYRCTKQYIWCFEYYAEEYIEICYRERTGLLWKTNFSKLFLERFGNLKLVKERLFEYRENDNVDAMFLLQEEK